MTIWYLKFQIYINNKNNFNIYVIYVIYVLYIYNEDLKKPGIFEKFLDFARSHSIVIRGSLVRHHALPAFLDLNGV